MAPILGCAAAPVGSTVPAVHGSRVLPESSLPLLRPQAIRPVTDFDAYAYPQEPELIVGLVAPIGTPLSYFRPLLSESLRLRGFNTLYRKLSNYAADSLLKEYDLSGLSAYERYDALMNLGNRIREVSERNDVLALFAASAINAGRPATDPRYFKATSIVIDQLKRPEEIHRLRKIYGEHFILLALSCPKDIRVRHLEQRGMSAEEAGKLIQRDEDEAVRWGQRLSDTYHLADAFVEVRGSVVDGAERNAILTALGRFWSLVFGDAVVTPTRDEYAMYLAHAAGLRSSSLARQVGAAIVTENTEVVALGANDIPAYPGGLYWGDEIDERGESRDRRDHRLGYDESDRMKRAMVTEILLHITPGWAELGSHDQERRIEEGLTRLKGTTVTSLTEFARAVHAEMEAITSAVRVGVSIRGCELYTTTFPCHNCAKHIVAGGIVRVVYIEPYPKSRALAMYGDSIHVAGESQDVRSEAKVRFVPFVGVAPRRYPDLFGRYNFEGRRLEYKDKQGDLKPDDAGLRIPFTPLSYVLREGLAARDLQQLKERISASATRGHAGPDAG